MATALELITDAWVDSGVGGISDTLPSADRDNYLRRMNRMLDSWSSEGMTVYELFKDTLSTVAGTASYASTSLASTKRPTWVDHAYITADGTDFPVYVVDAETYHSLAVKTSQGLPLYMYEQAGVANATFYLWPVPDAVYTLTLVVPRKFTEYAYGDTVTLPPGYAKAIVENLALEICAANNVDPNPVLVRSAIEAKAAIQRRNLRVGVLDTDFGINVYRSNILTDQ